MVVVEVFVSFLGVFLDLSDVFCFGSCFGTINTFLLLAKIIVDILLNFLESSYYYNIIASFFANVTTKNYGESNKRISLQSYFPILSMS